MIVGRPFAPTKMRPESLMARFSKTTLLCLLLVGCTSGSSQMGQRWVKDDASGADRDATMTRCLDHSVVQAMGLVDPSNLSDGAAARKYFVRACMEASGWRLEPPSPALPVPQALPR